MNIFYEDKGASKHVGEILGEYFVAKILENNLEKIRDFIRKERRTKIYASSSG